jgi:serine/threonine-protein phosphatase 5
VQEVSSKYFPDISIYAWAIPEDKARIKEITNIFKNWMFTLPFASIVNNKIVCIHGSVSHGWSLEKANSLDPNFETTLTKINDTTTLNAMWSDPHEHDSDFPNQRGCGMIVSTKTIKDVCIANGLDLQIRAHQVANNGFEMLKYNGETISITIFGTPNYCGFAGNLAGFAILRSNGTLELRSFSSTEMHEAFAPQTFDT